MSRAGVVRLAIVAGTILVIEALCRGGFVSPFTLIPPSEMVVSLVQQAAAGKVTSDLIYTLTNTAAAIAASVAIGFALGSLIHALPRVRRVFDPLLSAYYAVPTFVFYPLLIVFLGVNRLPLIVIGAMFGTVAMAVSTINGMDRIPRALIQTSRMLRMTPIKSALLIKLPAATPHLFTGVKLAVTYSLVGIVAGEFILSTAGLGRSIAFAYNDLDNRAMYGLLVLLLGIAVLLNSALNAAERRLYRRWGRP